VRRQIAHRLGDGALGLGGDDLVVEIVKVVNVGDPVDVPRMGPRELDDRDEQHSVLGGLPVFAGRWIAKGLRRQVVEELTAKGPQLACAPLCASNLPRLEQSARRSEGDGDCSIRLTIGVKGHPDVGIRVHLVEEPEHAGIREPIVAVELNDDVARGCGRKPCDVVAKGADGFIVDDKIDTVVWVMSQPALDMLERGVGGRVVDENMPDTIPWVALIVDRLQAPDRVLAGAPLRRNHMEKLMTLRTDERVLEGLVEAGDCPQQQSGTVATQDPGPCTGDRGLGSAGHSTPRVADSVERPG